MKRERITEKVKKELKLWEDVKDYVIKKMQGKTLTKDLEEEISSMIKERKDYLNSLKKQGGSDEQKGQL